MPTTSPEATAPAVLLVGWRSGSARALHELGCVTTALVSPHHFGPAEASGLVDRSIVAGAVDDVESALSALRRDDIDPAGFDLICSGSEFTLVTASVLGALGKTAFLPLQAAIALRDKMVQKSLVRAAGLRTAVARVTSDLRSLDDIPAHGVVVKPLAGAGASDTHHFRTAVELFAFATSRPEEDELWLVEDYVEGSELQIDGVIRGGEVPVVAVSRYLQNLIEVHSGGLVGAVLLNPLSHPEIYAQARDLVVTALAALGHTDGVFHLEAFVDDAGLIFSECAGRISGGMADESIRRMFGVDLHLEWARALLGRPHSALPSEPQVGAIGDVYLSTPAGIIRSIPTPDDFAAQPGVLTCRIDVAAGDVVTHDAKSGTDHRSATALVAGVDDREVESRLRDLADWFAAECLVDRDA